MLLAQFNEAGVSPDVFTVVQDYLCVPDRRGSGKGMVAGGAISPLLGGLYLTPLDRAMAGLAVSVKHKK